VQKCTRCGQSKEEEAFAFRSKAAGLAWIDPARRPRLPVSDYAVGASCRSRSKNFISETRREVFAIQCEVNASAFIGANTIG
jgi:hypothetical protein